MSRYAKAGQTIDDLKAKIESSGGIREVIYGNGKVINDLSKIYVDFENVEPFGTEDSYDHLSGLEHMEGYEIVGDGESTFPILWCCGGGDWEFPLVFVLYIGQKGELRGYIPNDGNVYNHKEKAAYGNNDGDPLWNADPDDPLLQFDADKLRADVAGRITVKGVIEEKKKNTKASCLTFRQLIQSLKDYDDQCSAVMPYAEGAEAPCWGIQYIWFNDGVLHLGQHDDEGLDVGLIVEAIEKCLPKHMLDCPAIVKIGTVEGNEDDRQIYDVDGVPASARTVSMSEVKANTYDQDSEFDDKFAEDGEDDSWFCKWVLKFA